VFSGFLKQVANPTFWGSPRAPACLNSINFLAILDPKTRLLGSRMTSSEGGLEPRPRKGLFLGGKALYPSVLAGFGVWGGQGAWLC